jgi:hypothetical protein
MAAHLCRSNDFALVSAGTFPLQRPFPVSTCPAVEGPVTRLKIHAQDRPSGAGRFGSLPTFFAIKALYRGKGHGRSHAAPIHAPVYIGAEATAVAALDEHGIRAVEQLPAGPTGPEVEEN